MRKLENNCLILIKKKDKMSRASLSIEIVFAVLFHVKNNWCEIDVELCRKIMGVVRFGKTFGRNIFGLSTYSGYIIDIHRIKENFVVAIIC